MAIAVLTSGGDSPGMNAAIRAIVRSAIAHNVEVFGVYEGYSGLYHNNIIRLDRKSVAETINRGGTILYSARFPEFAEKPYRMQAAQNLRDLGIDTLFVIGGNGSYEGAMLLSEEGINVIGLPGTIDNDIRGTEYTIGFDTALNTAVEAIDKIRDTSSSHMRASIVEVMGRYCGDIALHAAIATGAEEVITIETGYDINEIVSRFDDMRKIHKRHSLIIVSEYTVNIDELADMIESAHDIKCNKVILGHVQRGGTPTAMDRFLATKMGHFAVENYLAGNKNFFVTTFMNRLKAQTFDEYRNFDNDPYDRYKVLMKKITYDIR